MKKRQLGKSDLLISEVSFGCMSLGDDERTNAEILNKAIDKGMNFFDTADLYDKGQNELRVGRALKDKRKHVFIATKVGNQWRKDGNGWDWNPKKEYILSAVEESLRRLQTDYIDLYQLHGGTIEDPIDETIEAFETLQAQGKIRYYGVSSIRSNVIREFVKKSNIVSVMMQYSLLDRRPEEETLPLLKNNGIGVLARGSLAQGLLVNKPAKAFLNWTEQEVAKTTEVVNALSGKEKDNAQIAIGFVLNNPATTSAVVGIRTIDQLENIAGRKTNFSLNENEINRLLETISQNKYAEHR